MVWNTEDDLRQCLEPFFRHSSLNSRGPLFTKRLLHSVIYEYNLFFFQSLVVTFKEEFFHLLFSFYFDSFVFFFLFTVFIYFNFCLFVLITLFSNQKNLSRCFYHSKIVLTIFFLSFSFLCFFFV